MNYIYKVLPMWLSKHGQKKEKKFYLQTTSLNPAHQQRNVRDLYKIIPIIW